MKKNSLQENTASPKSEPWHTLSAKEVLEHLKVRENGLTSAEATARLAQYGPNQLAEAPRPGFLKTLWDQINSFVIWLLIIASVVSALLGDYVEAAAILAIVILNAVMGIIQERRAEDALTALKKLASPEAQLLRDGHRTSLPARDLRMGPSIASSHGILR